MLGRVDELSLMEGKTPVASSSTQPKNANFTEADLTGANLTDARLKDAIYNGETLLPDGFDPEEAGMVRKSQ